MAPLNVALLSLLLPVAFARPQMGQWGSHGKHAHKARTYLAPYTIEPNTGVPSPSGIYGSPPLHGYGGAQSYPAGNSSLGAVSATEGPLTVQSTITVLPQPIASQYPGSGNSQSADSPNPPQSTNNGGIPNASQSINYGGIPNSPQSTTSPGEILNSPQSAGNGQCGGTVTVTTANTVTVTVGAMGTPPSMDAPQNKKPPGDQSVYQGAYSALASGSFPEGSYSQAPTSSSSSIDTAPSSNVATSPQTSAAPYFLPEQSQSQSQSPVQPQSSQAPVQPQQSQYSPESSSSLISQPPSSSTAPTSTTTNSPSKVRAKGIAFSNLSTANAISGLGWGWNWDSNPDTDRGADNGKSLNYQYVPQMWGMVSPHVELWKGNSGDKTKYPYVMSFNEPNQPTQANLSQSAAKDAYIKTVGWNKQNNQQKITSPCVSNEDPSWLTQFFDRLKSSGDWEKYAPDCLCFHWYGKTLSEIQGVSSVFKKIQKDYSIPEIWMTEWALRNSTGGTDSIPSSDLTSILDWLETQSGLDRYAYNYIDLGKSDLTSAYTS